MKTNAVQRSLKSLRENGWTCHIVEKFLPARGTMKFPRRIDAFGIGDILACRPPVYEDRCGHCGVLACYQNMWNGRAWRVRCLKCGTPTKLRWAAMIALVQCCPSASHAEHKDKILAIPELKIWKDAGGRVFLQSWALRGKRGERKRWELREDEL
jgi:hypothetical protein